MKKLICEGRVPYGGGFEIKRPDLGMVGYGTTIEMLDNNVRKYRRANGIPDELGFSDELETLVCEKYPQECQETNPRIPPDRPHRLRLNDVITGTEVMATFVANGRPIVDLAEATRRANICAVCRYNVPFAKPCGGACGVLKKLVQRLVSNQTTPRASELNACFICKCFLESAVWMRADVQIEPLSDDQKAQFEGVPNCWKKESLLPK